VISELETLVQGSLRPDLTIILDLDAKVGLSRAKNRGALDRFEQEKIEFFENVRQAYLSIAAQAKDRCVVINADNEREQISGKINTIISDRFFG
jgi:dTMP kinase